MPLNLEQQSVTRISFDTAITILTSEGSEITLEAKVELQLPGKGKLTFEPDFPGEAASHILQLIGEKIRAVKIESNGSLKINFENDTILTIPPNKGYEAWGIVTPSGKRAICMPGGEVAMWGNA